MADRTLICGVTGSGKTILAAQRMVARSIDHRPICNNNAERPHLAEWLKRGW